MHIFGSNLRLISLIAELQYNEIITHLSQSQSSHFVLKTKTRTKKISQNKNLHMVSYFLSCPYNKTPNPDEFR